MTTSLNPPATAAPPETAPRILPAPRTGRWFGVALICLAAAWIAYQVLTNPGFQWDIVGRYMFSSLPCCAACR
jgi:polar amino acid transport system permease protein